MSEMDTNITATPSIVANLTDLYLLPINISYNFLRNDSTNPSYGEISSIATNSEETYALNKTDGPSLQPTVRDSSLYYQAFKNTSKPNVSWGGIKTVPRINDSDLEFNMSGTFWEFPAHTRGPDSQSFIYISAVVIFYGALLMTILGIQMRRRNDDSADEDYYALLVNRDELARQDMMLRRKMNVLRIDNVKDGYTIDLIPEHTV